MHSGWDYTPQVEAAIGAFTALCFVGFVRHEVRRYRENREARAREKFKAPR